MEGLTACTPGKAVRKARTAVWSKDMNIRLCRQILAERPYQYKKYSGELTRTWNLITEALATVEASFIMTTRQLRDHFDLMHKNRQKERKAEVRLSGIAVPEDE